MEMTEPASDTAPAEVDVAREWVEVLAVLLVGAAVAFMGHYVLTAWSTYDQLGPLVGADAGRWDIVLPVAAQGGSIVNALVIAVALGLVLVAPGPVGPWGRAALTAVSVVGVAVAALALLGIVEVVRPDQDTTAMWMGQGGGGTRSPSLVDRVAETLRWIPGLVVAGLAAWMAWRNLNAAPPAPEPEAPEAPRGYPEVDLGLDR